MPRRALVWFRADLRLHDHAPLTAALQACDEVVPLFVFDPRTWGPDPLIDWPRLGPHRARFWLESVAALRAALRAVDAELWVRMGDPSELVPAVARAFRCEAVYAQTASAFDEARDEAAVEARLDVPLERREGATLLHVDDLPFPVDELPDVFTRFRREVERSWRVRPELPTPARVPVPDAKVAKEAGCEAGELPAPEALGVGPLPDPRAVLSFRGGEAAGLERLETWVFEADALGTYKDTRNGVLHPDESSKLSPWLALGALSPRRVHEVVRQYEDERVANESTYWLIFELLWRDYFQLLARREGPRLFRRSGVGRRDRPWRSDRRAFAAWVEGETGYPFVDAFMKELSATGFMSNRGRQNVASFLAKTLGIDWRWGAAHFEAQLVDYDPCSNWGNWQYVAGVGTDPRDRVFNVVKQGRDYDPDGAFVKRWLPELASLGPDAIHAPGAGSGAGSGASRPAPIVAPAWSGAPRRPGRRRGRR